MGIFGALFGKVKIKESGKKFFSIASAVAAANEGDTILVKPGVYKEILEINKKVNIVGDAAKKPVIWSESQKPQNVITVSVECSLENLEVRGAKDQCPEAPETMEGKGYFLRMNPSCIFVKSVCKMVNVDVCYSAGFGISCAQENSSLDMERCSVHSNRDQAVVIDERASGNFREVKVHGNVGSGICCHKHSNVKMQNCSIYENYNGIICGESNLDAEKCDVSRNQSAGFCLYYGVKVIAKNCEINGNKSYGVECESTSVATFRECNIGESPYGIYCREGFSLSIQDCNIHDVKKKEIAIVKDSAPQNIQSGEALNAAAASFVRL